MVSQQVSALMQQPLPANGYAFLCCGGSLQILYQVAGNRYMKHVPVNIKVLFPVKGVQAGQDGDTDSLCAAFFEVGAVDLVIIKHLCNNTVSACIHFHFKIEYICIQVLCFRMFFGVTSYHHAKVGFDTTEGFIQIDTMVKVGHLGSNLGSIVILCRTTNTDLLLRAPVSPQGHYVVDTHVIQTDKYIFHFKGC